VHPECSRGGAALDDSEIESRTILLAVLQLGSSERQRERDREKQKKSRYFAIRPLPTGDFCRETAAPARADTFSKLILRGARPAVSKLTTPRKKQYLLRARERARRGGRESPHLRCSALAEKKEGEVVEGEVVVLVLGGRGRGDIFSRRV